MKKSTFAGLSAFAGVSALVSGIYYLALNPRPIASVNRRFPSDFISISASIRMFQLNAGRYPETGEGLHALVDRPASLSPEKTWVKMMDRVPLDPWQNEYRYTNRSGKSVARPFELRSAGPDGLFDTEDDISSLDEN